MGEYGLNKQYNVRVTLLNDPAGYEKKTVEMVTPSIFFPKDSLIFYKDFTYKVTITGFDLDTGRYTVRAVRVR